MLWRFFWSREEQCGQGHFIVDPKLTVGPEDEVLPLDGVQCQSVLTKNLGPFNTWESRLRFAKESGYNMIHFTPLQVMMKSDICRHKPNTAAFRT